MKKDNRFHNDRPITATDVRNKLCNQYHYILATKIKRSLSTGKKYPSGMKNYRRIQPEVHKLSEGLFIIKTPYYTNFGLRINFILVKYLLGWALISDINQQAIVDKLKKTHSHHQKQIMKAYHDYIYQIMVQYKVNYIKDGTLYIKLKNLVKPNRLNKNTFYLEISDLSLQSAYYRMLSFELSYCGTMSFLTQF